MLLDKICKTEGEKVGEYLCFPPKTEEDNGLAPKGIINAIIFCSGLQYQWPGVCWTVTCHFAGQAQARPGVQNLSGIPDMACSLTSGRLSWTGSVFTMSAVLQPAEI